MTLHDKIGENDIIDSEEHPLEVVSYEPTEVEAERPEERSDAQRIKDKDPEIEVETGEEDIDVSPHAVWKPKVKEEKGEEETEEEEETSEEEEEEEEQEEEEEKPKPAKQKKKVKVDPVQKRINKITREKYDAKREAERLAKELADAKKKLAETEFEKKKSTLTLEKPKEDDFETDAAYYEALGRWGAKMELHEAQLSLPAKEEEPKEETPEEARDRVIAEGKETYPDFEELVLDANLKISPLMVEATIDSKYAPDIFYLLAQSPDRAAEIAKMRSPAGVAREIGRIEAEFLEDDVEEVVSHDPDEDTEEIVITEKGKKIKKKKVEAPPPVKPLGGKGKVKKDLDEMSLADYYEARGYTRDGFKKSRLPH